MDQSTSPVSEPQLSPGLRAASVLGAMAFAFLVFLFFRHFWGWMPDWSQVAVLVAGPVLALVCTDRAARREHTSYLAPALSLVALAFLVIDVFLVRETFNLILSSGQFLACGCGPRELPALETPGRPRNPRPDQRLHPGAGDLEPLGYPERSRFLILPVAASPEVDSNPYGVKAALELRVPRIHVPLELRPVVDQVLREDEGKGYQLHGPRYRATLAVVPGHEPWLVGVERLPAPPAGSASETPPAPPGGCPG